MANRYWIVVRRENRDLFRALTVAFRGRTGFRVVLDRRLRPDSPGAQGLDRRGPQLSWGRDEFIVAERMAPVWAHWSQAPAAVPVLRSPVHP